MRSTVLVSWLSLVRTAHTSSFDSRFRIQAASPSLALSAPFADRVSTAPLDRSLESTVDRTALTTLPTPSSAEADHAPRVAYDDQDFYDPRRRGGRLLNRVNDWNGEPLNIIISARSSPDVLRESGLIAYSKSLGLWKECLDMHGGGAQYADLGDGGGFQPELFVLRQSDWPFVGSCVESVVGGNHFRAWKQNGTQANSGAWFLSASKEMDIRGRHKIIPDGYNIGRDLIVAKAIAGTRYRRRTWTAEVEWIEGLLEPGSEGEVVSRRGGRPISVLIWFSVRAGVNHGIAQDGRIALLTVTEF
ncbi:BZ3500_MvSof-1268-A1-R1_Chr1-1g01008 [Microbotryum saponariae]|uniref:BZ3500_MvSof-1268-A1-R1_Chr1-1g01008 protein n=1 Tax=Microbotryum saponariae TaxID=289078 RepID=A0A2X0MMV2_9BASI|nr:BZ3500_MvSof-1268-A1-R1_Chr1-1g01008 [Microbotryum saponariae]SCZ93165.1 BZ3501_MvSof-1269-A2-R1_Chr1-1g00605 [Microbotryum saponariae]